MGANMRRHLTFDCDDSVLTGTIDEGASATGLLIVSGGNEVRMGAHRGMAMLAQDLADKGYPVFRFDRRGIGDSEGTNGGFRSSRTAIAAAITTFRAAAPHVSRVVAFGNCDAATALVLHNPTVDALVLANPWVVEATDELPAPAAIRDRYVRRLRDPKAWAALLAGKLNIRAALRGIGRIATLQEAGLADEVATAMLARPLPTTILLAKGDNTAIAFRDAWQGDVFEANRVRSDVRIVTLNSAAHSFASDADYRILRDTLLRALTS
jgi:exosortase A-associated hydrolase 1